MATSYATTNQAFTSEGGSLGEGGFALPGVASQQPAKIGGARQDFFCYILDI